MKKILNLKSIFGILIVLFAIPSIHHIFTFGARVTSNFNVFLNMNICNSNSISGSIFVIFIISIFLIYFRIIEKRKELFKTTKSLFIFILVISILFALILPITSSDIYSYMTIGEIQKEYGANPYYDTILDIKEQNNTSNNEILNAISSWDTQLAIYGPLWTVICSIVAIFSFSSIGFNLILFKILAIAVHSINAFLIYKISKKKFWVIIYGLNPYILFEAISNVHNDIYLVLFTLLGLYMLLNKKNLRITLFFFACATAIKYITILLVPFVLIYFYRDKNVGKRILYCFRDGMLFVGFVLLFYFIYIRDLSAIINVFIQQDKYRESLITFIYKIFIDNGIPDMIKYVKYLFYGMFIIGYIGVVSKVLLQKEISFRIISKNYFYILLFFILIFITNLCSWYFIWLFSIMMFQDKNNIKILLNMPLIYEICVSNYFFLGAEIAKKSVWYALVTIIVITSSMLINKKMKK